MKTREQLIEEVLNATPMEFDLETAIPIIDIIVSACEKEIVQKIDFDNDNDDNESKDKIFARGWNLAIKISLENLKKLKSR